MPHRTARPVAAILPLVLAGACIPAAFERAPVQTPVTAITSESPVATASPSPSGPSARPSFIRPTPTPLPTFLSYVVKRGDTLTSIARAHRTTARSISFWNRALHPSLDPDSPSYAPNRIEVGWVLLIIPDVELDPEDLQAGSSASAPPSPRANARSG